MSKKINVAIVGLGFGAEFIPLWQKHPHATCYAICQRNEEKLNAVGDYFGVDVRYREFNDVLKDPNVDVVHINSPIPDHAWMSIAALKAGHARVAQAGRARGVDAVEQVSGRLVAGYEREADQ